MAFCLLNGPIGLERAIAAEQQGPQLTAAYLSGSHPTADNFQIGLYFENGGLKRLDSEYAYSQFSVTVDDRYRRVISAYGGDSAVTLIVEGTMQPGQRAHVSYYPSIDPLADSQGRQVPAFTEYYISTGNDWERPEVRSITVNGSSVILTFNKSLDPANKPHMYQFAIKANETYQQINEMFVQDKAIMFILNGPIDNTKNVAVSYYGGTPPLLDKAGNNVAPFNDMPADNQSKSASVVSATAVGDEVTVVFDQRLRLPDYPPIGSFQVKGNGSYQSIKEVEIRSYSVILKLYQAPESGQQLTVSFNNLYNELQTDTGMGIQSFEDYKVVYTAAPPASGGSGGSGASNGGNGSGGSGEASGSVTIDPALASKSFETSPAGMRSGLYTVPSDILQTAFDKAVLQGAAKPQIVLNIPTVESAGMAAFPLAKLMELNIRSGETELAVVYKDLTLRVPLESLDYLWLGSRMLDNDNQGYLLIEIDGPSSGISPQLDSAIAGSGRETSVKPFHIGLSYTAGTKKTALPALSSYITGEVAVQKKLDKGRAATVRLDPATNKLAYIPTAITTSSSASKLTFRTFTGGSFAVVTGNVQFADTVGHWANGPITRLANSFIAEGRTALEFKPKERTTRSEFASYLAKGLGLPTNAGAAGKFKDLKKHPDAPYIGAALAAGVVSGLSSDTFGPNEPITREQMAVMLIRAVEVVDPAMHRSLGGRQSLESFKDRGTIASWAAGPVGQAVEAGLMSGVQKDQFSPKTFATRAEAAVVIQRLLARLGLLTA